jgi:hypothetical protein
MSTPVGLLERGHVAWRLLQPVKIGLDLRKVGANLIYEAIEDRGFVEVIGHAVPTYHCELASPPDTRAVHRTS